MKNLKGLRIVLLLALLFNLSNCLPLQTQNEDESIPDSTIININGKMTPIIQEKKDLSEFFNFLTEMRSKKSLSIVGKDSNYIYLLVSDYDDTEDDGTEEEENFGRIRTRRSTILQKLGRGLSLIGPTSVRMIAVPISLFNFLGYLPIRLPGVPYHIDSGSPDSNPYDTVNHFYH